MAESKSTPAKSPVRFGVRTVKGTTISVEEFAKRPLPAPKKGSAA